jgi:exodeoxyribonuclease V beta subunit
VRRKLEELCDLRAEHPLALAALGADDADCWILDDGARERLRRALLGFDRASIFTIHAFCQRILAENAFIQGRLFDEESTDEKQAFHAAFVETLRRDVASDGDESILIEAWRRAGNSLERLERSLLDIHKKLASIYPEAAGTLRPAARFDADRLALAATAWPAGMGDNGALDQRVRDTMKQNKVHHSTANAWVRRLAEISRAITREEGDGDGDGGAAALLGAIERLDRDYFNAPKKDKKKRGLFRELADDLAPGRVPDPLVDELRRAALAIDAAAPPLSAALAGHLLPLVRARLERRKREAGLVDFQDMLTLVAQSLEVGRPRADELLAALRTRYRHALVDEFQDTDETQWQIFRRVFFEPGAPGSLTLVGDPKQAIYSFRGADVHTYLRARHELETSDATLFLSASYRATPELIAAQNALLENDDPAPFFPTAGPIHYDHPVSCGQPGLALVDGQGGAVAPIVVLDVARGDAASSPRLRFWEIKPTLLDRIATEVQRLLDAKGRLYLDQPARARAALGARDIFVRTRTNGESREVGEALRARRIPFSYFKQEKLFDTVEAQAVLDLLRALIDPGDRSARFRAFITPFFGLALLDLAACDDLPADHPLLERLDDWRALGEAGQIDQLFARILDDSGVVSRELFDQGARGRISERALTNYLHLFELLQEEAAHSHCTLRELAQRLGGYVAGTRHPPDRDADVQRLETDADAVQIMTVHQSKGLEAAVVFLYGATWRWYGGDVRMFHDESGHRVVRVGRQPTTEEALFDEEQSDEERRVLYVALTRARARLYLPRYPGRAICDLRGAYRFLNDRLHALLGGITPEEIRRLFQIEPLPCPRAIGPAAVDGTLATAVAAWQPPEALLVLATPDASFREAALERAGFAVTSYSALRRRHGGFVAAEALDAAGDDASDPGGGAALVTAATAPADELPRGRLSGTFLHDVIEHLPLATLSDHPAFDDWRRLPEIAALFERMRRRHDRDPAHLAHALRLVHTALTVPVRLGDVTVPGLGGARHPTREMEFLYPIPEHDHPAFSLGEGNRGAEANAGSRAGNRGVGGGGGGGGEESRDRPGWRIERGVVKGFIDYLFEHDGRVFVCDWKSDALPSWDADQLAAHCERNYAVQAQLYTLAVVRLFGLTRADELERRFGGVLYCFLRGMHADDATAGVYFHRPTPAEIVTWQRAMLERGYWGRS